MSTIHIKNGRIIDPVVSRDEIGDIYVEDGKIVEALRGAADETIDATGLVVAPGLVDLHVHFREPGREDKETIETGSRAAVAGGVTSVVMMPNTNPVADNQSVIGFMLRKAQETGLVHIFPTGTITKGREGEQLSEMRELKLSGAVAVSDDGNDVRDRSLLYKAMEYAKTQDMLIMAHGENSSIAEGGAMHEGWVATQLGLPGISDLTEDLAVRANIMLAERTGARLHLAHLSTKDGVRALKEAKQQGYTNITGEVAVQHIALTDEECMGYNTNAKMYPPLRSRDHVDALIAAIQEGIVDALATDHAPHTEPEKLQPFVDAERGTVGLETSFAVMHTYLVEAGHISLMEGLALMTYKPARIIRKDKGTLAVGADADIAIFDTNKKWTVDPSQFHSKGRNSVFTGKELTGKAVHTLVRGVVKMRDGVIL